ncbi:MAG: hypothetical protein M3P39_12335, partial [Actinomycetota bacterium]|nr:hypothetical protein [Actinomycetota bacterium]
MPRALACAVVAALLALAACGEDEPQRPPQAPVVGLEGTEEGAARDLGFPVFATKNTTRVGGADAVAVAAGVSRAVFPGRPPEAVALVDADDWRGAVAAAAFMG